MTLNDGLNKRTWRGRDDVDKLRDRRDDGEEDETRRQGGQSAKARLKWM